MVAMTTPATMTATEPDEVAEDLEVGAADVEALLLALAQHEEAHEVGERADERR